MNKNILFIGMDADKESIEIAIAGLTINACHFDRREKSRFTINSNSNAT